MKKIGFIGIGNMGKAILEGVLKSEIVSSEQIFLSSHNFEKCQKTADTFHVTALSSNNLLVEKSDIIFLAVKPNILPTVLEEIGLALTKKKCLVISIAAGVNLHSLQKMTKQNQPIAFIRAMPNVNAAIGLSVTALCQNQQVTDLDKQYALELFDSIGTTYLLAEKDFHTFSALAGSSPAFTYLYIDSLARAGVKYGLTKEVATQIAAQSVLGSAKLVTKSTESPWNLIDQVCSPGGTTVQGLLSLEDNRFMASIVECIDETIAQSFYLEEKAQKITEA